MNLMNNISILNPSLIHPLALRWKFSPKSLLIFGLVLTVALLAFYLFQVNEITQISFALANGEKQVGEIAKESKILENSFSGLSSLASLEALVKNLNYEPVGKINYIQMVAGTVVAK